MAYYLSRDPRHTVIGGLRGLFRLLYFTVVFVAGSAFAVAVRAVLPSRVYHRIRPELTRTLGRVLVYASNIRIRHDGNRPPEGSFIVANHLSWADSFTFLGELGCKFMVNHLYGEIMGFRTVLEAVGVEFVNRMSLMAIGPAKHIYEALHLREDSHSSTYECGRFRIEEEPLHVHHE